MTFDNVDTSDWTVDDHIEWMRHNTKTLAIMDRLKLNSMVCSMLHYDLTWIDYTLPDHLDALGVQQALTEHGPNPVLVRKA